MASRFDKFALVEITLSSKSFPSLSNVAKSVSFDTFVILKREIEIAAVLKYLMLLRWMLAEC